MPEGNQNLGRLTPQRKTGDEQFHGAGQTLDFNLLDFWRWSNSDLVDNTARGVLAEYIVAKALGISTECVRDAWSPWDLEMADGLRIQVKSAAYVQRWHQKRLSLIQFNVQERRGWSAETNELDPTASRHAGVYVFAILAHQDKATIDPLDLRQWRFYVLPTHKLDERKRSEQSIMLKSLEKLAGEPVGFDQLAEKVRCARPPTSSPSR